MGNLHLTLIARVLAVVCWVVIAQALADDEAIRSAPPDSQSVASTGQKPRGETAQEQVVLPADDPAVRLILKLQTVSVGFYWRDERGHVARNRYGDPLYDYSLLAGPDEDGRYRFARRP